MIHFDEYIDRLSRTPMNIICGYLRQHSSSSKASHQLAGPIFSFPIDYLALAAFLSI